MMKNEMIKDIITKLLSLVDLNVEEDWGTYNSFCNQCFFREGHRLIWCEKCGNKMVDYLKQPIRITYRQWIMSAITNEEKNSRMCLFIFNFDHGFCKEEREVITDYQHYRPIIKDELFKIINKIN